GRAREPCSKGVIRTIPSNFEWNRERERPDRSPPRERGDRLHPGLRASMRTSAGDHTGCALPAPRASVARPPGTAALAGGPICSRAASGDAGLGVEGASLAAQTSPPCPPLPDAARSLRKRRSAGAAPGRGGSARTPPSPRPGAPGNSYPETVGPGWGEGGRGGEVCATAIG